MMQRADPFSVVVAIMAALILSSTSGTFGSSLQAQEAGKTTATESRAKNQASAADTIILPSTESQTEVAEDGKDVALPTASETKAAARKQLALAVKTAGLDALHTVALFDGRVDADACESAALRSGEHSDALDAMADMLRSHGVTVTILSEKDIAQRDMAEQKHVQATKGYAVQFGDSPARWFATLDERKLCMHIVSPDSEEARQAWKVQHPALKRWMTALDQDAILAVYDDGSSSKGATWNMMEQELSSSGKGFDVPVSEAQVRATLVLKDGTVPWSDDADVRGALRPPVEQAAVLKLKTYMEAKLAEWAKWQEAHPDTEPPEDTADHDSFNAITNGDLEASPEGSTLGPSVRATQTGAVQRFFEELLPALSR